MDYVSDQDREEHERASILYYLFHFQTPINTSRNDDKFQSDNIDDSFFLLTGLVSSPALFLPLSQSML